jgi:hypothetical protein
MGASKYWRTVDPSRSTASETAGCGFESLWARPHGQAEPACSRRPLPEPRHRPGAENCKKRVTPYSFLVSLSGNTVAMGMVREAHAPVHV